MKKPFRFALAGLLALSCLVGCSEAPVATATLAPRTVSEPAAENVSYAQMWQEPGPAITTHPEINVVTNNEIVAHINESAARVTVAEPATGFALDAANESLKHISLAQLAQDRSTNPSVRRLSQMVEEDHGKANAELRRLAADKGLVIPDKSPEADERSQRLGEMTGAAFERTWVASMIEENEKDLYMYERESLTGLDHNLRSWASQKVPVLRHHLELARQIQAEMNARR